MCESLMQSTCNNTFAKSVQNMAPGRVSSGMKKLALTAALVLALAGSALADTFRVSYTTARGQGHRITVQAESPQEARRTVENMFPGSYVTGAHRIGK